MILICNSRYSDDDRIKRSNFGLTVNTAYTGIAMVTTGSVSYFLVGNDSHVPAWVPADCFDTLDDHAIWRFTPQWGVRTDRGDDGWWRVTVSRRELLPHIDVLAEALVLDDAHHAQIVGKALRSESARDAIIIAVSRLVSGAASWLEISNWALDQLDDTNRHDISYNDRQIGVLAELSVLDGSHANLSELSQEILNRI